MQCTVSLSTNGCDDGTVDAEVKVEVEMEAQMEVVVVRRYKTNWKGRVLPFGFPEVRSHTAEVRHGTGAHGHYFQSLWTGKPTFVTLICACRAPLMIAPTLTPIGRADGAQESSN